MTREEVIEYFKSLVEVRRKYGDMQTMKDEIECLDMAIKALEQEPKIGRWIFHKSFDNGHKNCNECIECSQCHTWFGYDCYNKTPYCPNCGTRMVEPKESEEQK